MRKLSTGFVTLLAIIFILGVYQVVSEARHVLALTPEVNNTDSIPTELAQTSSIVERPFCSPQVCIEGGWEQWIIVTPESVWEVEELVMLDGILTAVIESLNQQGLDGRALLSGYRFRRQHGEYVTGHEGRIAVVNHVSQEITLADAAFKRLRGFYIIHELGHVVDQRTGRQLSTTFHALVGSDLENQATANGFWLNRHAENNLEEATADAFALWITSTYAAGFRPVFAYTPVTTEYEGITAAMAASLDGVVGDYKKDWVTPNE